MFTVELRFKENGREVSFDQLADRLAEKFAKAIKEQITTRNYEGLVGTSETELFGGIFSSRHEKDEKPVPKAVSICEAARLLGIRPSTLRIRVKQGGIRTVHIGRRVLVPMESIERVVREGIPRRI